jgi:hypothetical protein
MSTVFLSVDVETSGPNPAVGSLLTIGAVPVTERGSVVEDSFYARVSHVRSSIVWEAATREWWRQQSEEARREAYEVQRFADLPEPELAREFYAYCVRIKEHASADEICMVAHPIAFDWQWVDTLMWRYIGCNPLGYKGLCLRSFGFGLSQRPWSEDRTDDPDLYVHSKVPHHALHDARAQAEQLSRMLRLRGAR